MHVIFGIKLLFYVDIQLFYLENISKTFPGDDDQKIHYRP